LTGASGLSGRPQTGPTRGNGGSSRSTKPWSFPDLQGHYIATTDDNGDRIGPVVTYDPWGTQTPAAGTPLDNTTGNADLGPFGSAGKLEEHTTAKPIVLMGARPYSPTHGRFLTIDPIQGGCANNYVYVHGNPTNTKDLSGMGGLGDFFEPLKGWVGFGVETIKDNVFTCEDTTFTRIAGALSLVPPVGRGARDARGAATPQAWSTSRSALRSGMRRREDSELQH
jgi:RHS repeat-associated protein